MRGQDPVSPVHVSSCVESRALKKGAQPIGWAPLVLDAEKVSAALLMSFYFYLRNQYYNYLISETEKSDEVVLSAAADAD